MQILAPFSVLAGHSFKELGAWLRPIVRVQVDLSLELMFPVSKGAVFLKFTRTSFLPIPAELRFVLHFEAGDELLLLFL